MVGFFTIRAEDVFMESHLFVYWTRSQGPLEPRSQVKEGYPPGMYNAVRAFAVRVPDWRSSVCQPGIRQESHIAVGHADTHVLNVVEVSEPSIPVIRSVVGLDLVFGIHPDNDPLIHVKGFEDLNGFFHQNIEGYVSWAASHHSRFLLVIT